MSASYGCKRSRIYADYDEWQRSGERSENIIDYLSSSVSPVSECMGLYVE